LALTQQEIDSWRDKLEVGKERCLSRKNFSPEVIGELEAFEKDLFGYDPDFVAEILRQIADSTVGQDGNHAVRIRYARSIIKTVKSGDPMEILLIAQMIALHHATMTHAAFLGRSEKNLLQSESYANSFNKLARTYTNQMDTLHRCRSGPEQKLTVHNVSVSDGGQAIVGHVTHNALDKDKAAITNSSPLVADQSGRAMPIVQPDERSAAAVPRIEQNQEPAPSATRRKRRA